MRRFKWAQTLVQNPAHHVQLIAALFGRLPAEQHSALGLNGEISPDANPWAARWMADLRELEPFDERGVVQRVGSDVRAHFLDRELTADFIAMDVTILRLQSLSVQVPPGAFRKWRDTPRSFLRRRCRSGGAVLKPSVKRASGSRLWRRTC